MKKKILLLMGIFYLGVINAQVGINTQTPLGILHIDPLNDTNANGTSGDTDDIVVTNTGQVGIGTTTPTTKLHIRSGGTSITPKSALRIQDGSEANSKVLVTVSADGKASWKYLPGGWYAIMSKGETPYQTTLNVANITFNKGAFSENVSGATMNLTNGSMTVPYSGTYKITVSGNMLTNYPHVGAWQPYIGMFRISATNGAVSYLGTDLHCMVVNNPLGSYISFTEFVTMSSGSTVKVSLSATTNNYANKVFEAEMLVEYIKDAVI